MNAQSIQRGVWLESALDEVRRDLEEDRFASAIGHFREALGLSRGLPVLKARVDQQAKVHSHELLPENWRVAETILQEAAATEPHLPLDPELLEKVEQARHGELVTMAIYKADRLQYHGKAIEARQSLSDLLNIYPDDLRIQERIQAFDHPELSGPPELVVKMAAAEMETLAESKPVDAQPEAAARAVNPFPTRILIPASSWNAVKTFCALAATVAMLGFAGLLIFLHFSTQRPQTAPRQPARQESAKPAAASPASVQAGGSVFQDVPVPPSDKDSILQAVKAFSQTSGDRQISGDVVDEVDVQGKQAKVRYRPKEKGSAANRTFSLVRQNDGWKVEKVE